jgi:hypothetical protein
MCAAPNQFPTICILIGANFDERSWGEPAATPSRELGGELPLLVVLSPLMNGRFAPGAVIQQLISFLLIASQPLRSLRPHLLSVVSRT